MRTIVCPNELTYKFHHEHAIFMAGGITGCEDWQTQIIKSVRVGRNDDIVLVNPRRENFDVNDPGSSEKQIDWEFRHLNLVDEIRFWFPEEGKCAITLFELGWALGAGKKIKIGCDPKFYRAFDVLEQVKHRAPWLVVQPTLRDLYYDLTY